MYIFMLCTKSLYFSGHSEEMGRMQWREPDRSEKCRVDQWGWLVWFVPSFDNKKYKKITRFCIPVFEDGKLCIAFVNLLKLSKPFVLSNENFRAGLNILRFFASNTSRAQL